MKITGLFLSLVLFASAALAQETTTPSDITARQKDSCKIAGCSSQLCVSEKAAEGLVSTCEWNPVYWCMQKLGVCEKQPSGECGWTVTEEMARCESAPEAYRQEFEGKQKQ